MYLWGHSELSLVQVKVWAQAIVKQILIYYQLKPKQQNPMKSELR